MNCHVEWIRYFLLRKSTIQTGSKTSFSDIIMKSSLYSQLSALRYQLLKPGFISFIDHTFYSITISIIDPNYSYQNSNFSIIRSYLSNYIPNLNISINELESKSFSPSHYVLCKSILIYYIRFYIKPSAISPTCFGSEIKDYEKSLCEWGRSICKSEIPYLPGNFMIDFGTAQVVSIILSKIHPELIHLNQITFSQHLNQTEIARNWREVGTALSVIGLHVPTEKEWGDNLCLLCFAIDLFRSIYNKSKSSNLVEYHMQQNQTNQQKYYENIGNSNNYCAKDEINKVDYLISQMNSISNGNPHIYLSEPFQQNPILVQQQRILQQQQNQQQLLQLMQDQLQQQQLLQQQIIQPQRTITFNQPETNQDDFRVKIASNRKPLDSNHCESKRSSTLESQINNDIIYQRAEKYKLLEKCQKLEKHKNSNKVKKSNENKKTETIQNFKIMSSFAIDPSFPNQCKLTTSKEVIRQKKETNDSKEFKTLKTLERQRQKKKKKNESNASPKSSVKCSYVTFDNNQNSTHTKSEIESTHIKDNSKSHKNDKHIQSVSKSRKNHQKHLKNNSLFDDVIEADKPDFQNPKSSQDFQNILSKQKEEFKKDKKKSKLDGSKSGTELLNSINSFIEQQREAIAAASLVKKVENSQQISQKPLPDFSQFDISQPESIRIFDTDPVLLLNSKPKDRKSDKQKSIQSMQSSSSSSSSLKKKIDKQSSFSDPLVELAKNGPTKNHDSNASDHSQSSSSIANHTQSKRKEKTNSNIATKQNSSQLNRSEKLDSFENSNSATKLNYSKSKRNEKSDSNSATKQNSSQLNRNDKSDSFEDTNLVSNMNSSEFKRNDRSDSFEENNSAIKLSSSKIKRNDKSDSLEEINSASKMNSFEKEQISINSKSDQNNSYMDSNIPTIKSSDSTVNQNNQNQILQDETNNNNNGFDEFEIEEEESPNSFDDEEPNKKTSNTKSDFAQSNQNISNNFSQIKNSSKVDDFSMKSELTFPDIPSLIDPSFRLDSKIQASEKVRNSENLSEKVDMQLNETSEKVSIKDQLSDTEKKSFSKKRPIPVPPQNSSNFNSSNSKLPLLLKTSNQKSESLTPADLSIVSSLDGESMNITQNQKQEINSPSKSSAKNLNDDNELSIDQVSSEIKNGTSNSNLNSDSLEQSNIKKVNVPNSDSKVTNSVIENSQSSAKIESAVEDFIPEIEKYSSGNEQKKKTKKKPSSSSISISNESSQNNQNDEKEKKDEGTFKKFHSSSSSSDSIPFKVIHSDSEKNQTEKSNKKSEEEIDNSKPFTSVIEEFDLKTLKPDKNIKKPIQSISGPIYLNEEPIPKGKNFNKGPSSETRRVSFSIDVKGLHSQTTKSNKTSTNSSLTFNNDIDTFMSTASLSQSVSIPIEERLKMYSKDHNELSLPLSDADPEIVQEYRDESSVNVGKKYIWLSDNEQSLLENLLPIIISNSDVISDIPTFISKELKMPKNSSIVNRIAANIKMFLLSRGKKQ